MSILIFTIWRPWQTPAVQLRPLIQFEAQLWSGGELGSVVGTHLVLSPDGTRMAFVALNASGVPQLHTRRLEELETSVLPGTEGAGNPFFSPDGQWVAFWADRKLKKAPLAGGAPIILCQAPDMLGASWGDNGDIIATLTAEPKLWLVPSSGGSPRTAVELPGKSTGRSGHRFCRVRKQYCIRPRTTGAETRLTLRWSQPSMANVKF